MTTQHSGKTPLLTRDGLEILWVVSKENAKPWEQQSRIAILGDRPTPYSGVEVYSALSEVAHD